MKDSLGSFWINILSSLVFAAIAGLLAKFPLGWALLDTLGIGILVLAVSFTGGLILMKRRPYGKAHAALVNNSKRVVADATSFGTEAQADVTGQIEIGQTKQERPDGAVEGQVELRSQLQNFLRRFTIEWTAERDSEPSGIDDGKHILARAYDDVIKLRSAIMSDPEGKITGPLDEAARQFRVLSRHELYIDGGASFAAFWDGGNRVLDQLNALVATLTTLIDRQEVA